MLRNIIVLSSSLMALGVQADDFYHTERVSVPSASSFESIAHYTYLYHGNVKLGIVGFCSVSPSKRYALCEQSKSGVIRLFTPTDIDGVALWKNTKAYPDDVEWNENAGLLYLSKVKGNGYEEVKIDLNTLIESER